MRVLQAEGYLHFVEDEFVPQAVVPDDAFLHLSVLPVHGKVQQPLLEGGCGAALNLRGGGPTWESAGGLKQRESERERERRPTHPVVDAVQEPRHHGEDGGLKGFHVVRQESDVALEEAHPAAGAVDHRL